MKWLWRNRTGRRNAKALDLEGDRMKQLKIRYSKEIMLDVDEYITKKQIHELIDYIAADEVFQDGEYDEVEWEVLE